MKTRAATSRPCPVARARGFSVAIAAFVSASCNAEIPSAPAACREAAACTPKAALVAMGDSASSGIGGLSLAGDVSGSFGVDLGRDPQLATSRGRFFYLARDLDTVFELSPECGEPLCRYSTRREGHSGTTNPQDVAVAPDGSLWVPRFGMPNVAILGTGGREIATVELPDVDGDGNPNASAIRIVDVGGIAKAFVSLELLDDRARLRSRRPSVVLVIDVAKRAVERTIELRGRNPFNTIAEHRGRLFFSCAGNFDAADELDAGVERLDPQAPDRGRLLVNEQTLGGSASAVAITDGCGAAIVADATQVNATAVVTFDPESGEPVRTVKTGGPLFGPSEDFHFWALAWVEGRLLVGDRRRAEKGYPIHVFERVHPETGPCELVKRQEPIYVAQKPVALRATL